MASADSKFYDLSDADIDSYNDDAIPETLRKQLLGEVFLPVVNSPKNWKFTDRSE